MSTIPQSDILVPTQYVESLEQRIYQQSQRIKKLEKALNKSITKHTTLSIKRIQDLSKRTKYTKKPFKISKYWQINSPFNDSLVNQNLIKEKHNISNPKGGKQVEYKCLNNIVSWEDMKKKLWQIFSSRS